MSLGSLCEGSRQLQLKLGCSTQTPRLDSIYTIAPCAADVEACLCQPFPPPHPSPRGSHMRLLRRAADSSEEQTTGTRRSACGLRRLQRHGQVRERRRERAAHRLTGRTVRGGAHALDPRQELRVRSGHVCNNGAWCRMRRALCAATPNATHACDRAAERQARTRHGHGHGRGHGMGTARLQSRGVQAEPARSGDGTRHYSRAPIGVRRLTPMSTGPWVWLRRWCGSSTTAITPAS